ncbi:MAG: DUF1573 domain-containing protein [Planctomycetaceae bacterium]|nr:MAG: DUF1573 domain-containing protein [Planctomycetaceae bacterium]
MFKTGLTVAVAAAIGLGFGWLTFESRYGGEAEFGPFSTDSSLSAADVSLRGQPAASENLPKIEVVNGEEFEFGVMEPGGEGKHIFIVRNVGTAPLELQVAGSTCKCTVGTLDTPLVEPGEQTEVVMTWNAKSEFEEFGQSARLKTNDPTRGELNLKIRGQVVSSMAMSPRSFSFGDVESGDTIRLESVIYSFSKTPITAVSQSFSDPDMTNRSRFTVEEVDVQEAGDPNYQTASQAFRLAVEIDPGLRQGPIRENFVFEFAPASAVQEDGNHDPDSLSRFTAEITGKVVGAITLVESRRLFGTEQGYFFTMGEVDPKADPPLRANILLRGPDRDSIRLQLGDIEPAGVLRAELGEPVGRSTTVLVPLLLWVDPDAGPIELMGRGIDDYGVVWIRGEGPEVSPLKLRIRFVVR